MNVEIPELVPMDDYDARQAKLDCGMRWLLTKASHGAVPSEYQEAFFSLGLSSVLAPRLTSSELYWSAAASIFPELQSQAQQGHAQLIQFLLRRGVYLAEVNGVEVNEQQLRRTSPLHLMAHLTLLEGLMTAYVSSIFTPEKVVPAVRKFAAFSASNELPASAEEAAVFWINKSCAALCCRLKEHEYPACPETLALSDINDVNDGRCLAALVSFYCPQQLPIAAVQLGDSLGIADSLYNLQLLYNFCREHFNAGLLSLSVMDLFYTPETLQLNLVVLFADLFHCLELEKPACVRDTGQPLALTLTLEPEPQTGSNVSQSSAQLTRVCIPQISNLTKQSFHHSVSTNHATRPQSSVSGVRQPLLPRRHSDILSADVGASGVPQPLMEAWAHPSSSITSQQGVGFSTDSPGSSTSLLSNVMLEDSINLNTLDSSIDLSHDSMSLRTASAASIDGFRPKPSAPNDLGPLLSSASCDSVSNSKSKPPSDRLVPAQLRPSKEKSNNHSKKCEYSEHGERKKHNASTPDDNDCGRSEPRHEENNGSSSSTPSDGYKTPSDDGLIIKDGEAAFRFEASTSANIETNRSADCEQFNRNLFGSRSYVIHDRPAKLDEALAAGLPVVGIDPELHKLQADYKDKEIKGSNGNRVFQMPFETIDTPFTTSKPPIEKRFGFHSNGNEDGGSKTSFAQIKKLKEADEASTAIANPGSQPVGILGNMSRTNPLGPQRRKKATFGVLPNQTTWIKESAQRASERSANHVGEDSVEPMPSELFGLRMKLEENRRQIENRKRLAERQWNQQRQQMGKEAFIQVITKNKSGSDASGDERSSVTDEMSESIGQSAMTFSDAGSCTSEQGSASLQHKKMEVSEPESTRTTSASVFSANSHSNKDNRFISDLNDAQEAVNSNENAQNTRDPLEGAGDARTGGASDDVEADLVSVKTPVDMPERADPLKYDVSLSKINSSLSELQGEIQRLSRQQDQINNLVRSDLTNTGRIGPSTVALEAKDARILSASQSSQPLGGAATSTKEEFYLQHFGAGRAVDQSGLVVSQLPPGVRNIFHNETTLHQSRPTAVPYSVPSYPPLGSPFQQRYHPTPSLPISHYPQHYVPTPPTSMPGERMYSPVESGHPFVGLGAQYHPQSGMYPVVPGMYPVSVPPSYSQYQGAIPGQYPHMQNLSTMVPRPELASTFSPHRIPVNDFPSPQDSFSSPTANPHPSTTFYSPVWPGSDHGYAPDPHSGTFTPVPERAVPGTPEHADPSGAFEIRRNSAAALPQDVSEIGSKEELPQSGGFFVNFGDAATPPKPKPNLKSRQRSRPKDVIGEEPDVSNAASMAKVSPIATLETPVVVASVVTETETTFAESSVLPSNTESSPLVFVIGQSTENEDDWLEMEKRKQRLCELQTKRLEEQELRREKLQREQERKREQQRVKQEMADQKRADDKARREAIFQVYLQKKREKELSEETPPKVALPPVMRRQRSAALRATRPKSQPALQADVVAAGGGATVHSGHSSQDNLASGGGASVHGGHSSQNNLTAVGGACKTPVSELSQSNDKVDSLTIRADQVKMSGEINLAFGGLTHRRPNTPDQISRIAQPASDGSESSGSQFAENYTGPKLFVKPSQKSNRHIIINAISHCCLAGIVNQDVKNKVLEEIAKSDAKHFIILFRDAAMQYRGLYMYNPDQEEVLRIHGVGPKQLTDKVMEKFYKYNSGSKKFTEVTSTKHLSATIDAITVLSTVWQKTRPVGLAKKPA